MSKTIKYVECAHCGETVGTYYVTCPYCGYKLSVRKPTGMDPLYGMNDRRRILQAIREPVMEDVGILPWPPPSLVELEEALDSMDHDGITRGD